MNDQPQRKSTGPPPWWEALKDYLSPEQQKQFITCYHFLFKGDHSPDILWALVNILGLQSMILHRLIFHLEALHGQTGNLHKSTVDLEARTKTATETFRESALLAQESAAGLRDARVPWGKVFLIVAGVTVINTLIALAIVGFHGRFVSPSP